MKKQHAKKLNLKTETLAPLQPQVLDDVAGGAGPFTLPPPTTAPTRFRCQVSLKVCL